MTSGVGGIWIQGAGELASGVALRLVRCGYRVVMAELARPKAVRRLVAFSEAINNGSTRVEEIEGVLETGEKARFLPGKVVVLTDPHGNQIPRLKPQAVVDARMTKQTPQPLPRGSIPLIGLGPGFVCGRDADLIVETHREARLGAVIDRGSAAENTGIPGRVGGQTARRVVRSPAAGRLVPLVAIGDLVTAGQLLGRVAGQEVRSAIAGLVKGLVHDKTELIQGEKVADIDPRGPDNDPALVTDKSLAVAGGVLEALLRLKIMPLAGDEA